MEPIKGVGGKRRAKTLHHICLFWVHSSTGELPTPKSTQDVRANFSNLQSSQARSLGLGVRNSAHSSNITSIFPKLPSTYRTNFVPKTTIRTGKILAIQWCAQVRKRCGGCKFMPWEAYLATCA